MNIIKSFLFLILLLIGSQWAQARHGGQDLFAEDPTTLLSEKEVWALLDAYFLIEGDGDALIRSCKPPSKVDAVTVNGGTCNGKPQPAQCVYSDLRLDCDFGAKGSGTVTTTLSCAASPQGCSKVNFANCVNDETFIPADTSYGAKLINGDLVPKGALPLNGTSNGITQ